MIFQKIGGIIISVNMMCGLEIHVQLETESKLFCDCPTNYKEAPANSNICPVCLNQPVPNHIQQMKKQLKMH